MKAVIYARYSSDNQREESIEGQIRECTAFAEKNGITILRHYIDRAFSAKTDNRPEFQNMIKDSGKRLFDMIIVWKLDRFARNRYDSARYKTALKKNGVKVVSATEVISDGAEGIILESVLEGYAEYYSADLSEKVVRGMTENALKSKYNGGTLPIGYQIDSDQCFQLDPLTAPFVREAFQRYDEGATMTQIRDWLNEQGVKNTRGQKMTYNSIQHLLNNRRYIGEYTYRDIVVPDGIPAIVPQDLFDRVQEKLAKNKKTPARHKAEDDYLLTTKLFCGYCGAYLCGESGTSHTGNVHHYYKCVSVKKKRTECHKKSVRKEWIEDLVVNETMKMVMDDTAIEAIVSMLMDLQDRENVNLPLYEQQLREADTAIQNLLNAIQQGILTKSTKGRLEELEVTKEELETKIACEKLAKPKVSAEFMTFWLHRFRKLDVRQKSHRKILIDTFINAIFLYDDKMVITFNYKDGTDTITFDDLKTALADKNTGSDLDCSTAPKPPRRLLLYGRRGGFFFAMHPPADRARSPRFQLRCAERKLVARQAGIAQHELVFVLALHSGLLLDRHGVSALLQHPPDEHIHAVDPVKGRDQIHARSTAADVYHRPELRTQAVRQIITAGSVFLFHAAGVPLELPIAQKRRQCKLIERIGVVVRQALLRAQRGDQLPRHHDVAQPHGRKEHLAERPDGEHTLRCKLEERGRRWSFIVELALKIVLQEIRPGAFGERDQLHAARHGHDRAGGKLPRRRTDDERGFAPDRKPRGISYVQKICETFCHEHRLFQ